MRKFKMMRASVALGAMFIGSTHAGSVSAAKSDNKFAGFCTVEWLGEAVYYSSVFQSDEDDRRHWKWEFEKHLLEIGERNDSIHSPNCRLWEGADALESANAAAAEPLGDHRRIQRFNWVPKELRTSGSGHADRPTSTSPQPTLSAKPSPSKPTPAPSKYVEVAGPNGTIRLSPEVVARNQAAADDYRRKMDEHARAQAEHERKLALHQQSIAAAAAEKRAYEQKLAMNGSEVAAHNAAMEQYTATTRPPAKGAKGWMYCDARGAVSDKRRFYSRIAEVAYVPGEITIIDVMARNRPAFKSYVAGVHSIFFATDSLLHCPYSTTSLAEAEALMARDKRGDANNAIEITQTGWTPAS